MIGIMLQFGQLHLATETNTFCNLGKYNYKFGQIQFAIWTNTFCKSDKYILKIRQIHFAIWTNVLELMSAHQVKSVQCEQRRWEVVSWHLPGGGWHWPPPHN